MQGGRRGMEDGDQVVFSGVLVDWEKVEIKRGGREHSIKGDFFLSFG